MDKSIPAPYEQGTKVQWYRNSKRHEGVIVRTYEKLPYIPKARPYHHYWVLTPDGMKSIITGQFMYTVRMIGTLQ